jgi:N-terminal acetyltransferase 2
VTDLCAGIYTQLALAYAVHKSFIFIRVPLTAAILPKVVKTLRGWGWQVGKIPTRKAVTTGTSGTASASAKGTGVNTKGSGVKSD